MNVRVVVVAFAAACASGIALGQGAPNLKPMPTAPVQVTNGPNEPVPVRIVNPPSTTPATVNVGNSADIASAIGQQRVPVRKVFDSFAAADTQVSPIVPSGKRFVASYLSVLIVSGSSALPITDAYCVLSLSVPSGSGTSTTNVGILTGQVVALTPTLWSASTQFLLPLNAGELLHMSCAVAGGIPPGDGSAVEGVLTGYLEPSL